MNEREEYRHTIGNGMCYSFIYIYVYICMCFFKLAQWEKKKKTIIIDKHILLEKPLRL